MTGPAQKVRDLVYGRDGMSCALCGSTYALTLQHRRARGMGGTKRTSTNSPAALVVLCGSGTTGCHGMIESQPDLARSRGYRVGQYVEPPDVPILWHGAWVFLCDDGTVHRIGGGCPIPGWDGCSDQTPCIACPRAA